MQYIARQQQQGYGRPLGILVLKERIPCPPGTPGNPTTFPFPVIYECVEGVAASQLRDATQDSFCLVAVVRLRSHMLIRLADL